MRVFILALLLFSPAYSYKFLCNGITAEGETESDSCGACTDIKGPRWPNNTVSYNVSTKLMPPGVSATDWVALVQSSFASWTGVPGVLLSVNYVAEGVRSFGENEKNHDIFWVMDE